MNSPASNATPQIEIHSGAICWFHVKAIISQYRGDPRNIVLQMPQSIRVNLVCRGALSNIGIEFTTLCLEGFQCTNWNFALYTLQHTMGWNYFFLKIQIFVFMPVLTRLIETHIIYNQCTAIPNREGPISSATVTGV